MRHIDSHVIKKLSSKWKELGSQLNIDEHLINSIESDYCNDSERCCRVMLHKWLKGSVHTTTWEVLIDAVDKVSDDPTGLCNNSYIICLLLEN